MKTRGKRRYVTLLLWLLIIKRVKTDGKLDIRFISYWSDGKKSRGHCCDTSCPDKCDPKFTLCIDRPDGRHLCSLYKSTTNYTENKNIINFGSSIQGTANPFIIHVPNVVPSSIHIQVEVYDNDDTFSDDHMDTLSTLINISAAATQQEPVYTQHIVWGRTQLYFEVRAYCDPDWYGSACERCCNATTDHSHCTCHLLTGVKMCFEGWKGDNCNQDFDECTEINNTCQSWGSCTNTLGSFGCICMEGIKDIINITLLGEIDHTNKGDLADGLNRLITELGGIPGKVDVKFMTNTQRENNFTTTYVQLYSDVENGSFIESPLLNEIFESNPDEVINQYLPLPLYPPREETNANTNVTPTMPRSPHDSWDTHQYMSAILPPVGLVLMSVLLLVAFCTWKRRSERLEKVTDDDQIGLFVINVPCNRNLNRADSVTSFRQDASLCPEGDTSLDFDEAQVVTLDTVSDEISNTQPTTEDVTLDQLSIQGSSVSENARLSDVATLGTRRHVTSLDPEGLPSAVVSPDNRARLGDFGTPDTHNHVTSYTPLGVLPCTSGGGLPQTNSSDPLNRCKEEDEECAVVDDNNVEDISEENPYVDLVVMKT